MKISETIVAILCLATIAGHVILIQYNQIQKLELQADINDQARSIDADQIRDLLYTNQQLCAEKESIAAKSYVSGVASVLDNKEHFQEIWHDGYNRGSEVQTLAYKKELDNIAIEKFKDELNLRSPLADLESEKK